MGVLNRGEAQIVYIDTPGFHKPRNVLGKNMIKAVQSGLSDVDAVTLVIEAAPKFKFDAENLPEAELQLISEIRKRKLHAILAINKIDLLKNKKDLFDVILAYTKQYDFDAVVPVSALSGDGVTALVEEQLKFIKSSPHFFPDDAVTDQPERVMVAEMIREKLLQLLDKEIPHGIAVDLERFFERDNANGEPILEVDAVIYCERESHKGIIIGKGGNLLKKVGTSARQDIEEFFGCKVDVKLWVKVKEDWRNRGGIIHTFGLD